VAEIQLDRLLMTFELKGGSGLLVTSLPPLMRLDNNLRPFQTAALTVSQLSTLLGQIDPPPNPISELPGFQQFDIWYGGEQKFRVAVLGVTKPRALVVTLLTGEFRPLMSLNRDWSPTGAKSWMDLILRATGHQEHDVLLITGAPALSWTDDGLQPIAGPTMSETDIQNILDHRRNDSGPANSKHEPPMLYLSLGRNQFRVAEFETDASKLLLLIPQEYAL
jgi:Tfp pilus assembly pilus retraction ATPase PilT